MIYLIRHGLTQWNTGGIFRGRHDIPLSDMGRRQTHMLGKYLAEESKGESNKKNFGTMYTSPLSRAHETATIIAEYTGSKVVPENRLTDVNFGNWQGKNVSQVKEQYPDLYKTYKEHPEEASFPEGETLQECFLRCSQGFFELVRPSKGSFMLVSHRVVLKLVLIGVLQLPLSAFWRIQLDTCSISTIGKSNDMLIIKKINSTCHLSEDLDFARDF